MTHDKFKARRETHDELEGQIMNIIRPHTTRKHLPDRLVSFNDRLVAWDAKANVFVEDNSHDEYFRIQNENDIPVFIVYENGTLAEYIDELIWSDKMPASPKSTTGDDYYIISGGIPLEEFLKRECTPSSL